MATPNKSQKKHRLGWSLHGIWAYTRCGSRVSLKWATRVDSKVTCKHPGCKLKPKRRKKRKT